MAVSNKDSMKAFNIRKKIKAGKPITAEQESFLASYSASTGNRGRKPGGLTREQIDSGYEQRAAESLGLTTEETTSEAGDLASFAAETVTVESAPALKCGACGTPAVDGQLRCGKCGANVRTDLCPKCKTPYEGDEQFCKRDATPRPKAQAMAVVSKTTNGETTQTVVEPIRMWTLKNTRFLCDAVDLLLRKSGMDELDTDEQKQLAEALVPVLNKRLPATGAYAEEIRLGVVVLGIFGPRAYIKLVVIPEREEKAKMAREKHAAEIAAIQRRGNPETKEASGTIEIPVIPKQEGAA